MVIFGMEPVEFLLKVVTPIGVAVFLVLKKKEITRMLSNFSSGAKVKEEEISPDAVMEKMDAILRRYNE